MSIILFEALSQATGKKTPAAVAVALTSNGVRFFRGQGGRPWTTERALNEALGLSPQSQDVDHKPKIEID